MSEELERVYTSFLNNQVFTLHGYQCMLTQILSLQMCTL